MPFMVLRVFEDLSLGRSVFAEIQTRNHPVQPFAPEAAEPLAFPEPFYQIRADCVIAANEHAAQHMLFQNFISESPQRQHLGRAIGAVDAGRDIAALAAACAESDAVYLELPLLGVENRPGALLPVLCLFAS